MDTRFSWEVSPLQIALLKETLTAEGAERHVRRVQRAKIRRLCVSPELKTLAPHEFFVLFKHALNVAAGELSLAPGGRRDELLSRLFSICVEEFFRVNYDREIQPSADRVRTSSRERFVVTATKLSDEACRGMR